MSRREKKLLDVLCSLYPRIPAGGWKLSAGGGIPDAEAGQELLEEAHEQSRTELRQEIPRWLADPARLRRAPKGLALKLSLAEAEALLQVLNDIRVGSWMALGSPEKPITRLTRKNAPDLWAMEMSTLFQAQLLESLQEP